MVKGKLTNQRLLELIGEIDNVSLRVNPSMGNDGYTSVSFSLLGKEIEVFRDNSRGTSTKVVTRSEIAEALRKYFMRGLE